MEDFNRKIAEKVLQQPECSCRECQAEKQAAVEITKDKHNSQNNFHIKAYQR